MKRTFQIELNFEDALERMNEIHLANSSKVSKVFFDMKVVAATFGVIAIVYDSIVNEPATFSINNTNYPIVANLFSGLIAGMGGVAIGCFFYVLNQLAQKSARKKEAKRYLQNGENKYLLHVEDESIRIEKSKSEEILIHLREIWTALPKRKFVFLRLSEDRAAILPRYPQADIDLWEHIKPSLKPKAERRE